MSWGQVKGPGREQGLASDFAFLLPHLPVRVLCGVSNVS